MKIFKKMTREEAKKFYEKIKKEPLDPKFKQVVLNDLIYFTDNFKKDY